MAVLSSNACLEEAFPHRGGGGRIRVWGSVEDRSHAIEPRDLVIGRQCRVVGDIVGVSGKAVERVHMRPQAAPNQKRSDRKSFAAAPLARGRFDALGTVLLVDHPGAPFETAVTRPPQGEDPS